MIRDRQFIAACRIIASEYEAVLTLLREEIERDEDTQPLTGSTNDEIVRKAVRRDAVKEGVRLFIGKLKTYGNQRPQ